MLQLKPFEKSVPNLGICWLKKKADWKTEGRKQSGKCSCFQYSEWYLNNFCLFYSRGFVILVLIIGIVYPKMKSSIIYIFLLNLSFSSFAKIKQNTEQKMYPFNSESLIWGFELIISGNHTHESSVEACTAVCSNVLFSFFFQWK